LKSKAGQCSFIVQSGADNKESTSHQSTSCSHIEAEVEELVEALPAALPFLYGPIVAVVAVVRGTGGTESGGGSGRDSTFLSSIGSVEGTATAIHKYGLVIFTARAARWGKFGRRLVLPGEQRRQHEEK
jgi:hypothetical protein